MNEEEEEEEESENSISALNRALNWARRGISRKRSLDVHVSRDGRSNDDDLPAARWQLKEANENVPLALILCVNLSLGRAIPCFLTVIMISRPSFSSFLLRGTVSRNIVYICVCNF